VADNKTPEYHIAFLGLMAAGADGSLTEGELTMLVAAMEGLFTGMGKDADVGEYLSRVAADVGAMSDTAVEEALADAVEALHDKLPQELLQQVFDVIADIAGEDELEGDEEGFLAQLHEIWFDA